ncbi:cytochrome P450 family protein [Medicago truncatula]|uniref:Cytochrome P450 family protein n=1 Tax=Medicago truncatula TaxID=3880 RepID=G7ZXA4_MEDTR|nr:cytochrome P450 family protein [Medicago truncatula]
MTIFKGKSIGDPKYAPVKGTVFNQLFYFKKLHDYHAQLAKTHPTMRLLAPNQSELYRIDVRNIEHILKTNFDKYSKGKYNQDIITDLFGEGIFAVDGDKWKQQRKIASYEFSTRVLRDFSCSVFRKNASKLVRVISEFSHEGLVFDMQDLQMRCALDSIFKVGFGTELNSFDESNALIYWRYVDPIWNLKTCDGRTADAPDVLPDGHKVEKGDGVYYLAYAMGRMSSIWGEDVDEFCPERWINNGIFQPESPFKFVAFHAGPRMCLGKDFAYRQMKIVAMCVLNFYNQEMIEYSLSSSFLTTTMANL